MKRLILTAVVLCLVLPARAVASTDILLAFAQSYQAADGAQRIHRGVDVAACEGSGVACPVSGQVAFAGRVPGPDGGTVLAVSVDTPEGRVSMLPLAQVSVSAGDRVESGEQVGLLAGSGDPSSDASHLHLSLRKGSVYLDSAGLLVAAVPSGEANGGTVAQPAQCIEAQPLSDVVPSGGTGQLPDAVTPGVTSPAVQVGMSGDAVMATSANAAGVRAPDVQAGISTQMQPGVALAPAGAAAVLAGAASVSDQGNGSWLSSSLHSPRLQLTGAPIRMKMTTAVKAAGTLVAVAVFAAASLLTRRALTRQAVNPTKSNRLGSMLQHLRAGDTIPGLTSCSGPTAFTVPGPSAQGR